MLAGIHNIVLEILTEPLTKSMRSMYNQCMLFDCTMYEKGHNILEAVCKRSQWSAPCSTSTLDIPLQQCA